MDATKIRLSPSELELATNAAIILTKNTVLQKTKTLLEDLQKEMKTFAGEDYLLSKEFFISPKISRGENYLGLPYLVLDYPRNFGQEDVFVIRSMFWWGNFFSSTLQLSGSYKTRFSDPLKKYFDVLCEKECYFGISEDAWQHHFEESNYVLIKNLSVNEFQKLIDKQPHIKIAAKFPITEWHLAANKLFDHWKTYLQLLNLST